MNIVQINKVDIANGPGVRVAVWCSGCPIKCKGCFNKEYQDPEKGVYMDQDKINEILDLMDHDYIDGISILGGEPLASYNLYDLTRLVQYVRHRFGDQKTIWLYTGYTFEELDQWYFMNFIDVIVDGPFIESRKMLGQFRGSSNQRFINVKESLKKGHTVAYYPGGKN